MLKLVIVFGLTVCCLAYPLEKSKEPSYPVDLIRPSPISPDIPSDPKPEEKITLITDPKVQPLIPSKPTHLPGPYVLPGESLLRPKREDKDSSESDENSSEEKKNSAGTFTATSAASSLEKHANNNPSINTPLPSTIHSAKETDSRVGTSSPIPTHPRIPYTPHIHQHNEHLFKRTTQAHSSGSSSTSTSTTVAPSQDHASNKRDIPVPLTPKDYHHSDGNDDETKHKSSLDKVPKEEINQEEKENEGHNAEPVASASAVEQHPATFARPIPVAELFAKKP